MKLRLASSSPRRAELLNQMGIQFDQFSVSVDEVIFSNESPKEYLKRIVKLKLSFAKQNLTGSIYPILVADTIVTKKGKILGKPKGYQEAEMFLLLLSNSWHKVMSRCAIEFNGKIINKTRETWVKFRKLNKDEIKKYWLSGEPQDKAGAYAIQGRGATFVERIEGSYSGVVGLDIFDVSNMLSELGLDVFSEESSHGIRASNKSRNFNKHYTS